MNSCDSRDLYSSIDMVEGISAESWDIDKPGAMVWVYGAIARSNKIFFISFSL